MSEITHEGSTQLSQNEFVAETYGAVFNGLPLGKNSYSTGNILKHIKDEWSVEAKSTVSEHIKLFLEPPQGLMRLGMEDQVGRGNDLTLFSLFDLLVSKMLLEFSGKIIKSVFISSRAWRNLTLKHIS